jgi:flagellum-specific peptidoglycan hydrolase FlgJ
VNAASKPWWQQATAVVGIGASGAITSFSFAHGAPHAADPPSPAHIRLLALQQVAKPAPHSDALLRSAIVNVAQYYLRLSASRTPAEMEALIWQHDSSDGVDHGPSCAAFASLTLEMGSRAIGQQSWVTGGSSYPWPLHDWADVRVDPNPASPAVVSVLADAQAHDRWHPLGDGYIPKPGDWVLFDGHVEVVTRYAGGVLHMIGGDSLPNFSVNAHEYANPLSAQGVAGFVNNGEVRTAAARHSRAPRQSGRSRGSVASDAAAAAAVGAAAIPGTSTPTPAPAAAAASSGGSGKAGRVTGSAVPAQSPARGQWHADHPRSSHRPARPVHQHHPAARADDAGAAAGGSSGVAAGAANASVPGAAPGAVALGSPAPFQKAASGAAVIPGLPAMTHHRADAPGSAHAPRPQAQSSQAQSSQAQSSQSAPAQMTAAQRAFIAQVAPGAVAAQQRYGVPASVTIAQAIDESGWGQSVLASKDHNLFGMKGVGPAGTDTQLTQEYENGQWVVTAAPFRAYQSVAQSIDDHGRLLATSDYYKQVMAAKHDPDAFASGLTGVYATDPNYGQTLIGLMRQFNLYRYDHASPAAQPRPATPNPMPRRQGQTRRTAAVSPGQASVPGAAQPSPGSSTSTPSSGTSPARGSRPGASSPPRTGRPAPGSPPRTARPAPSSPPNTGRPSPSSPPNSSPGPGSPARTSRPAPSSPARAGQPAPASAPVASRPATGSRPASGSTPRTARPAPGSAAGGAVTGRGTTPTAKPSAKPIQASLVADWTPAPGGSAASGSAPAVSSAKTAPATTAAGSSAEPEADGATAEWSLSDWVPGWANEAAEPVAAATGTTVVHSSTGQYSTGQSRRGESGSGESGSGQGSARGPRVASGLRGRLAAVRPGKAAKGTAGGDGDGRYQRPLPRAVRNAFQAMANGPLLRAEPLYRDVAGHIGLPWELLAACDWMQCEAKPRHSPVHGEKLGTGNADGTVYWTKSAALEQCADELVELARTVYGIDLTAAHPLSVQALANAFAAFRWGGLLKLHHTSAMEFPYSVAGLTVQHIGMRWPTINEPNAPDKPGSRFRMHFGAVPVLLSLGYPAAE